MDWTPDLHRRFVQAVEQLGLDKAVPSRILELMGIDCLTRHNIASHLQVQYKPPFSFSFCFFFFKKFHLVPFLVGPSAGTFFCVKWLQYT